MHIMCCFMCVYYVFVYSAEVVHCTDGITEMAINLQSKISEVEGKIKYQQEQLVIADRQFKELLRLKPVYEQIGEMDAWERRKIDVESALKDSNTNLNSETRMLSILKGRLQSGNYMMTNTSCVVKRKFTD